MFYGNGVTIVIHVDDCLIFVPQKEQANFLVEQMGEHFTMTDEGSVENYLGMKVEKKQCSITLSQTFLIRRILDAVGGMENRNVKTTPAQYQAI